MKHVGPICQLLWTFFNEVIILDLYPREAVILFGND